MANKPVPGSHHRKADHPIDSLFLDRWSPRAMSGEELSEAELMSLFEAARWARQSAGIGAHAAAARQGKQARTTARRLTR